MTDTKDILIRQDGKAGRITLNRPKALNALSYEMVLEIEKALIGWRDNPSITCIIIDGEGDRAFCAGGDIEDMYRAGQSGDFSYGAQFWHDEYRMNALIASYPKPYVALMHGFVMGGGVGVSAHGSHRIVTETSMVAMPECGIGLIPDVGGTHILGKAPGYLGEFAGLTGYRLNAADAILLDFADVHVPTTALPELVDALTDTGDLSFIDTFAKEPEASTLEPIRDEIDTVFGRRTVPEIVDALNSVEADWALNASKALKRGAPLSLICTVELVRSARENRSLSMALQGEFRFTSRSAEHGEFLEGIRAAIIDKDRNPKWRYPTLDEVPQDLIDKMLTPVEGE